MRPRLRPDQMLTYAIQRPAATHWRPASCAEVACPAHLQGWRTRVEGLTPELAHAARTSGRRYVEQQLAPGETWLVFEPGQACFAAATHRVEVGRAPLYVVRGGDARGNPLRHRVVHASPDAWVDDFATNQDRLNTAAQRG
jgi:hypothetical protein